MSEMVNHPKHYQQAGRKECIVEMEEKYGITQTSVFCLMNAYKYLYRDGNKADNSWEQDRKKAKWYFDYAEKLLLKSDFGECLKNNKLYLDIEYMLCKGDKEMEKSKMVETVQKLEEENRILREKLETLRTRCKESARDMFDNDIYGCLTIVRGGDSADCGLNFDSPLDFAKSIIEHKTVVDGWTIEAEGFTIKIPTHERVTFGYDELIEIAEYLLIYCKHNKEDL